MNDLTIIVEYTPLFQLLLLYALFYYRDIGRFLHPRVRKESKGLSDWYNILVDLKLISLVSVPVATLRKLDRQPTKKIFYFLFMAPALLSSLTDVFFIFGTLSWYMSLIFQTVSALLLIIAFSYSYLGGTASYFSSHSTKLRDGRRSGSRIKHLLLSRN